MPRLFLFVLCGIACGGEVRQLSELALLRTVNLEGETNHVQGIAVARGKLWLTSVDRKTQKGYLREFDAATGKRLREVEVQRGAMYHPGGLSESGGSLWLAVAEYEKQGRSVIEERSATDLRVLRSFEVSDHIGCVAAGGSRIYGGNWDSRTVYEWSLEGKELRRRQNPLPTAYQDWKLSAGKLVASGNEGRGGGAIHWLDPESLQPQLTLRAGATDRGVPFTNEGMAVVGDELWLAPEDTPTRVFVYSLAAQAPAISSRLVPVDDGKGNRTSVPVSEIRGTAGPGPTLALVAGNHGYEYPPILAMQRLLKELNPAALRGTVLIVHIANVPSFLGRSLFVNPVDGKNLNRVYPGKPDGTLSERIAHVITTQVIEKADVVLDLHAGDGNESLRPYVYQAVTGDAAMDKRIADLAAATLFDHIVIDRGRPTDPALSMYCSTTATTRGKPAVTVESGYLGSTDDVSVERTLAAVRNVMRHMGMLPGPVQKLANPVYLDPAEVLPSPATGVFHPKVDRGQYVQQGALLAEITDFFGNRIAEMRAPFSGVVLYIIGTPPVNQGNPAVFLGAVKP